MVSGLNTGSEISSTKLQTSYVTVSMPAQFKGGEIRYGKESFTFYYFFSYC